MTYIKILLFALLQFLLITAIAQPAERWVRVEYTQRIKDHVLKSVHPDLKTMMQVTPSVLVAGKDVSIYEENGATHVSTMQQPSNNTEKIPLKNEVSQTIVLPSSIVGQKVLQKIYKSFRDSVIVTVLNRQNNLLRKEEPLSHHNWTILNEVTSIAGMTCRKAFCVTDKGTTVEAWFTDAIPISHGPLISYGLPGLILKIETSQMTIEANKISFISEQTIERPTEGTLIKTEDLQGILNTKPAINEDTLKKEIMKNLPNSSGKN
ncbi:GLPGLI family protein [Rhodoflexus sp.]